MTVYKELIATRYFDVMDLKTDEDEHSIEMHLPYTAKIMERLIANVRYCEHLMTCFLCPYSKKNHFTIVPVLVGALKRDGKKLYGQIFSKYLMDPTNLFVISSDFYHWVKQSSCLISNF